jgi:CheY-like chemotaxis protein
MNREELIRCIDRLFAAPRASRSRNHILIVEDNPDNLMVISAVLKEAGMDFISAQNGPDSVRLAKEKLPKLILMDIQLPGMSGTEAARIIRSEVELSATPIIAVTAKAMSGERENIMAQGFDDYISKPIDPEELIAKIRYWENDERS